MKWIVNLIAILLLAGCAAADAGDAFPEDEAGMCAYVNIGESIDLENATEAYTQILELSATHAIGTIAIGNVHATDNIHVYVDVDGWIVAYLTRGEQTGKIVQWSGISTSNPVVKTTFGDSISKVCDAIGVTYGDIKGDIQHYDFEYPDANGMAIFLNTRTSDGDDYTHVLVPDTNTLYAANYSLVNTYYYRSSSSHYGWSQLYVDGGRLENTGVSNKRILSEYDIGSVLTVGESHTIQLKRGDHRTSGWSGVANILIYS